MEVKNIYWNRYPKKTDSVRVTVVGSGKAVSIIVGVWIQHAMRVAMLSSVAWLALQYFPHYLKKRHDFRKKNNFLHIKCVLILSTASVWNISHSKKKWARCEHELPVALVRFRRNLKFLDMFSSSSTSCSWRVRRVSCSLILKMKLVLPSIPRSSYVPSSFWFLL